MPPRIITCPGCGRVIAHYAKALCNTCYKRAFYPWPRKGRQRNTRPALALAQQIGATAAAALVGVGVDVFRSWACGAVATPGGADLVIRRELVRLRRVEGDG